MVQPFKRSKLAIDLGNALRNIEDVDYINSIIDINEVY